MRLRFTRQARCDIDAVYEYIAADDPVAAQDVLDQIEKLIDLLPDNPKLGHDGRVVNTRELVVPGLPYFVVYELSEVSIDILSILHSRRRWPPPSG